MNDELLHANEKLVVGYAYGKPVSIGILFVSVDSAGIFSLVTSEDFQGKGYGRFLLHDLIDSLKDTPMDSIILEARPSNAVALHLYETLGFQKIGIKKDYYNDELGIEDAIVLQKHL